MYIVYFSPGSLFGYLCIISFVLLVIQCIITKFHPFYGSLSQENITNAEKNEWYIYQTPKRIFKTTKPSFLKPVQVETVSSSEGKPVFCAPTVRQPTIGILPSSHSALIHGEC